jgi:hypothetical protein
LSSPKAAARHTPSRHHGTDQRKPTPVPATLAQARRRAAAVSAALLAAVAVTGTGAWMPDSQAYLHGRHPTPGLTIRQIAAALPGDTGAEGVTRLGARLFVAVRHQAAQGAASSPAGATSSEVRAYTFDGRLTASWTIPGQVSALAADPAHDRIIATVGPDARSSLYTIAPDQPAAGQLRHYTYRGLTHAGGASGAAVFAGHLYLTATHPAPAADGSTFTGPVLYQARINDDATAARPGTVDLTTVLADGAAALDQDSGRSVRLNLSTPGSARAVPAAVPGDGGTLALADEHGRQLVFAPASPNPAAPRVLVLAAPVDDTAFATSATGTLYVVDATSGKVLAVTGPFTPGEAFGTVPAGSPTLPGAVIGIDLKTGRVSELAQLASPGGLLFVDAPTGATTGPGGPSPTPKPTPAPTPSTGSPGSGAPHGPVGGPGAPGGVPFPGPGVPGSGFPAPGVPPTFAGGLGHAPLPAPSARAFPGGTPAGARVGLGGLPLPKGAPFAGPVPNGPGQAQPGTAASSPRTSPVSSTGALAGVAGAGVAVGAAGARVLRRRSAHNRHRPGG